MAVAAALSDTAYDLASFRAAIGDVPVVDDPALVRLKSRDFFWYSPILKAELRGKSADLLVVPRGEADIVRVARAAVRHRVPITIRGGGTGNYGQAVPLAGGVVLDMGGLDAIEWQRRGIVRVGAGKRILDIDAETRPQGWELRMHPSTKRTATIGGFVAGGSGGIGSITYGGLRDPGNVLAARIVTMEEEPRVLELRDTAALTVNHAYGTTGIITALEMPLAPALPWIEAIVAFDDFAAATRAAHEIALADGIVKKLLTPMAWPLPSYLKAPAEQCPEGKSILVAMIAEFSMSAFAALAAAEGGQVTFAAPAEEGPGTRPLYEYTWNHATLHALKIDKTVTYLQSLFPAERLLPAIAEISALLGDEVVPHLEFIRYGGRVTASGLYLVRFTTPERLRAIIALHEAHGVFIADPHVVTLEDGTRHKRANADQLGFKGEVDPYGLLNPGKMRSFVARR